jgi:hypothetical protein
MRRTGVPLLLVADRTAPVSGSCADRVPSLSYSGSVEPLMTRTRRYAAAGILVSLAAMTGSELLWRVTAPPGCPGLGSCTGAAAHPHALAAILLGLTAVAGFVWRVSTCRRADGRPVVVGGWRHPIDALGVRYRDLPGWRKLALAVIVPWLVAPIFFVYQVRRALLGPPAE